MKYLIVLLLLCSCASPLFKAKKHWQAIEDILLKHPEIADSLQLVKRDTIKVDGFKDTVVVTNDSTTWDASFFDQVDTAARQVIAKPGSNKPVQRLQQLICPAIDRDSTYHIRVYNSQLSLWVPVHLNVHAEKGRIEIGILSEDVRIPEPKTEKEIIFKSEKPKFYSDQWFWAFVISLVLLCGFTVLVARK